MKQPKAFLPSFSLPGTLRTLFGAAPGVTKILVAGIVATMLLSAATATARQHKSPAPEGRGWWIGGDVGMWYSEDTEGWGTTSVTFSPQAGYDFNKRWGIGLAVGYSLISTETEYAENIKADIFVFSPYARWRFYNPERVSLFLDGGIGVAGGDMDGVKIGIQPGIAVRVSKHVRFQALLGFLGYCTNYFNDGNDETHGFGFRFSSSDLKFGFHYTF